MATKRKSTRSGESKRRKIDHESKIFKSAVGDDCYLTTSTFKGIEYIHIRRYTTNIDGISFPSKKGISFNRKRWAAFRYILDDLRECVDQRMKGDSVFYRHHIGGGVYASVKDGFDLVDLRHYFVPKGQVSEIPTKRGISIRFADWKILLCEIDSLHKQKPYLLDYIPCYMQDDHANQMGMIECNECSPFNFRFDPFVGKDIPSIGVVTDQTPIIEY